MSTARFDIGGRTNSDDHVHNSALSDTTLRGVVTGSKGTAYQGVGNGGGFKDENEEDAKGKVCQSHYEGK